VPQVWHEYNKKSIDFSYGCRTLVRNQTMTILCGVDEVLLWRTLAGNQTAPNTTINEIAMYMIHESSEKSTHTPLASSENGCERKT